MRPIPIVSMTLVMAIASILIPDSALAEMSKKQQAKYPAKDELPNTNDPIVKKWVAEIDWSKVPKLPLAKAEIPNCPDCPKGKKGVPKDACWWTCDGCVAPDDIEVCPREKAWGLTYDDGPSEETPRLLKKLKQANVTSTFFVVGSRVLEYPETLLQQVKEGHHIGLHTWSHAGMTTLTNEQIVAEIKWAEKVVFDVTGLKTKYWRPPYGDVDNRVREIVRQMGYKTVIWTKEWDSNDWQIPDKTITNKEVFRNFKWALSTIPKLKGGVITLEHDLFTQTVNVAGPLLDMGMKKGLEPMDIARCVNDPEPYQNSVLTQKPAAKPAAAVKPAAAAPAKPVTPQAQTPLEAPKVASVHDDDAGEDETIAVKEVKKSGASQLAWSATCLAIVAASAFFSL
ncbi:chitin deacetylase [Linnemannia exigua]|uniref:Chitin deacetylase n=1 Tax=Linnemannia exigua TaxID=604196 RepID=A0AAD4H1S9_9FUNG|nr:chitin deacetylase [Linnemannia exigua]